MEKKSVVIAEDDYNLAYLCAEALSDTCIISGIASNGEEALGLVSEKRPDVLILDMSMPRMDGLEVISILKSQESTKDIHIIVISCFLSAGVSTEIMRLGVDYIMVKPISYKALEKCINVIAPKPDVRVAQRYSKKDCEFHIMRVLKSFGMMSNYSGFYYFCSGIQILLNTYAPMLIPAKRIYADIAQSYGKSADCIERSMRYALSKAWEENGSTIFHQKFNNRKPKVFQFINDVTTFVQAEDELFKK